MVYFIRLCVCFLLIKNALVAYSQEKSIKITGSDLLKTPFERHFNSIAQKQGLELDLKLLGSWDALYCLEKDVCDIALTLLSKAQMASLTNDYVIIPFAKWELNVFVPEKSEIRDLSLEQVQDLLSKRAIFTWNDQKNKVDLEEKPGNEDLSIKGKTLIPVVNDKNGGVIAQYIKHKVLMGENFNKHVCFAEALEDVDKKMKSYENSIVISAAKELKHAQRLSTFNEEFNLIFYLVYNKKEKNKCQPFMESLKQLNIAEDLNKYCLTLLL